MEISRIRRSALIKPIAVVTTFLVITLIATLFSINVIFAAKPVPVFLDPKTIPKYVNELVVPPVYTPTAGTYTVKMVTSRQKILPTGTPGVVLPGGGVWDGMTNVWAYQGDAIIKGDTLKQLNPLWVNGYTQTNFVWSPSATFEAVKGTPITVKWINNINVKQPFAVDPTLYWANPWKPNLNNPNGDIAKAFPDGDIFSATGGPFLAFPPGYIGTGTGFAALNAQEPVPLVPHLHGAEVPSQYDGGPEAWWTSSATNLKGPNYNSAAGAAAGEAIYVYPNAQEPNTLWYHDHALGITRINVMSGLAGFYLLRDPAAVVTLPLTAANLDEYLTQTFQYGISEIPIAIQDRTFKTNGELWFPEVGLNPTIHPYWMPEFFGNTIMVNGMVWPNLDVTPGWYRFRLLDGSNARFYTLSFSNGMSFTMIGADGGYLQAPVVTNTLTIAPGERADILIQFTQAMVGQKIILTNTAKAPFPNGAPADKATVGQIIQFTVKATTDPTWVNGVTGVQTLEALPATLNPTLGTTAGAFPTLTAASVTKTRYITLNEVMGAAGPVMVVINGQHYYGTATETPTAGTVEEWVIINLTADTHPIHLHLVTFQLVSRQPFQAGKYNTAWLKLQIDPNTGLQLAPAFPDWYVPKELNPTPWYQRAAILPTPTEMGWKDTLQMNPGEVTTIRVRFASQDGLPFAFDPTAGPGYVWHCHIIDHEDNEMMRPMIIK